MEKELTASEALFGFVGWLTSRKPSITMSSQHDAGGPCNLNLVGDFIKVNKLKDVTESYPDNVVTPEERI